jgi:predicted nucleotidyltransferase
MMRHATNLISIQQKDIESFCRRFGVKEFSLFGSILRDDFRPDSDVDVMLEFLPGFGFTFENTPEILNELGRIFGHEVDVVEKGRIRNRFRRHAIMSSHKVLYAA